MAQMAQYQKGNNLLYADFTPAADVAAGDVVVSNDSLFISTGGVQTNGAGVGTSANRLGALVARGGWFIVQASGAIPIHSRVYWDATAHKVTVTRGTNLEFGLSGDTAAADGDFIPCEFLPNNPATRSVATGTVAAAGSTQADAASLAAGFNLVTGADGTKGVLLPASPKDGTQVVVKNADAANAILKVYPAGAGIINALSASAAISMAVKTSATFTYLASTTTWYTTPLLPS